ncbi:MAG: hypothetical protein ACRD4E_02250 [Bryobacteraceae bacterium]
MPAKPVWYSRINDIVWELQTLPRPFIDRATLELVLGVGRRRAQQIMRTCVTEHVGANGLADRETLIARLIGLARDEDAVYEVQRRRKVAGIVEQLRRERLENPRLLVEAPAQVVNQQVANLPAGVEIEPGRITVEFASAQEALERLLALAMALSNDFGGFERRVAQSK